MQKIFLDANICLDLLDSTRKNAKQSISWYIKHKDDTKINFYFSGDFITTFYYVLSERKKIPKDKVVQAIKELSKEIEPIFINYQDFQQSYIDFDIQKIDDFEDLLILNSASNFGCHTFITNDKALLNIHRFKGMKITSY